MYEIKFTRKGKKDLQNLPKDIQKRIIKKLDFYSAQKNPLHFSKSLVNLPPSTYRFSVGSYRIAFFIKEKTIYVEQIKHRKEVYK